MVNRHETRRSAKRARRGSRRGAVLIAAMVCVAVATVVLISIVRMAGAGRRTMQTEAWRLQAAWLAESGLERAAWRLASDGAYSGETWTVAPEALAGGEAGVVEIEVEEIPGEADRRLVRVRADYPDQPQHRARQSRRVIVQIPVVQSRYTEGDSPIFASRKLGQSPSSFVTSPQAFVSGRSEGAPITEEEP